MGRDSDLTDLLRLKAQLMARPEGGYMDRHGNPCRHPAGLYSQSLDKLITRMHDLTKVVPTDPPPGAATQWQPALSAVESVLVAVDSHADDLKAILAATRVARKTTMQAGRQIDDLFEELVGRPIGRVRPHGERFETFYALSTTFVVYGYYVAGVRADGVVAPSERAHGSSGTHWSYAVSVRRLLGQVILAARIVHQHVRGPKSVPGSTWSEHERANLRAIAGWVQACPPYCFPNEQNMRIPSVGLSDGEPYVRLKTLNRLRSVTTQPGVRWSRSFSGDGVSKKFSVV